MTHLSDAVSPHKTHQSVASLQKIRQPGLELLTVTRGSFRELHLTLTPLPNERPAALCARLGRFLRDQDAHIVQHLAFGENSACAEALTGLAPSWPNINWPVMWLRGGGCAGNPIAGMQILAVGGTPVETLELDGRPVGRTYSDGLARYAYLGDIRPVDASLPRPDQARIGFESLQRALAPVGMGMGQVVRTWLFLEDLLAWYGPFNAVRTQFFKEHRIFDGLVPASTGIGASNPCATAISFGALAVSSPGGLVTTREVCSPLQCPAPQYGSSFSRAIEILTPDTRRLMISGTASIEPEGASAHVGNIAAQIHLTMAVVDAILETRGLSWEHASRAIAYFKQAADVPVYQAYCAEHHIPSLSTILTESDVCRDELLFEIELDALAPIG